MRRPHKTTDMKKLILLMLMLFSLGSMGQTMTIRYFHKNDPGHVGSQTFDITGTPTKYYRLAYNDNGIYMMGPDMRSQLKQPIFPDVSFKAYIPSQDKPICEFITDTAWELQPDGYWVVRTITQRHCDPTWNEIVEDYDTLQAKMKQYLVVMNKRKMPNIPDGNDMIWKVYNPAWVNPWEQWIEVPVQKGLYNGQDVWVPSDRDDLWDDFRQQVYYSNWKLAAIHNKIIYR